MLFFPPLGGGGQGTLNLNGSRDDISVGAIFKAYLGEKRSWEDSMTTMDGESRKGTRVLTTIKKETAKTWLHPIRRQYPVFICKYLFNKLVPHSPSSLTSFNVHCLTRRLQVGKKLDSL